MKGQAQPGRPKPTSRARAPKTDRKPRALPEATSQPVPQREGGPSPAQVLAQIDLFEATVEKLVAGGEGLARVQGVPIFLPRTAPGDRVRARVVERRPQYGRAEVLELLAPGPGRRSPPCPYFSRCGGCDLQHLEDALQTQLKVKAAVETLSRLASLRELPEPRVIRGSPWAYRLRTDLHTAFDAEGTQQVGFYERRSRRLIPVERCPVLVPELDCTVRELSARARQEGGLPPRLGLASGQDGSISIDPPIAGFRSDEVVRTAAGFSFEFDARCFFQAHSGLLEELVAAVVGDWRGELAVDLYCGVGFFTLPLAQRYARVLGVEGDGIAARYAKRNARNAALRHVEIVHQAVDGWSLESLTRVPERVVLDPPRIGLPLAMVASLRKVRPSRLTLVSCHVATFARDLSRLLGAYRLESLTFLDLFPQTGHLEAVAQLVAAGEGKQGRG